VFCLFCNCAVPVYLCIQAVVLITQLAALHYVCTSIKLTELNLTVETQFTGTNLPPLSFNLTIIVTAISSGGDGALVLV